MPDIATILTFYAAVLAMQLTPGPDMVMVIGRGVGQGRRTAIFTAVGMTLLAGLVQLPLLALGVASLIQASPMAFDLLRWAGSAYLIWLGIKLLLGAGHPVSGVSAPGQRLTSDVAAMRQGMISNLLNPKPNVFMLAFLPLFVEPASGWSVAAQLLFLGTLQKFSGLLVLGIVALGAGTFGGWLSRRPHLIAWQERFAGTVMVILGLRLAFAGDGPPARLPA